MFNIERCRQSRAFASRYYPCPRATLVATRVARSLSPIPHIWNRAHTPVTIVDLPPMHSTILGQQEGAPARSHPRVLAREVGAVVRVVALELCARGFWGA